MVTGVHCTLVWLIDIKNFRLRPERRLIGGEMVRSFSRSHAHTHASEVGPNAGRRAPGLMLFLGSGWARDE